jgi:Tol biopolymer transport system component
MVLLRITLTVVSLLAVLTSFPTAAPRFSEWSAPANLGSVNSSSNDTTPAVSKDGRSLYFGSNRPSGKGGLDIWVSQWDDATGTWGTPDNAGDNLNSEFVDTAPALSRDEHWLLFHSNRPGGRGGFDLWASYREHTHDALGWQTPVNVGSNVNSGSDETDPDYFENEDGGQPQLYFSSNRPGLGGFDFYVSTLQADGTFGPPGLIADLSSTLPDPGLMVRFDGLEAVFYSRRSGGILNSIDMWTATRETVFDPWSTPRHLTPLNTASIDQGPHIAADRETLYFASDRSGGAGGLDLYVATRSKESKP